LHYTVALTSLGCSKNLVDSEVMLGLLQDNGYQIVQDHAAADAIIVNTCGFILPAKEESIATLLSLAQFKESGRCQFLLAVGCLVEKYQAELEESLPEVDGFVGSGDFPAIVELLNRKFGQEAVPALPAGELYRHRLSTGSAYSAYVKIAEGCDNCCTYCLIPQMRGPYRSRPMGEIQAEVRMLAARGVKEINLIAQDTTYYGLDLYGEEKLPELLDLLAGEDVTWLRLFYAYPGRISEELLQVMARHDKICKYLDIPIQHADTEILRRMGRGESLPQLRRLLERIREIIPDMALRTTCLVGFPGETEEQFQTLLDFMAEARFDWLGAFTYSQEADTPAADFSDQVPEAVKQARYHRLMSLQSEISAAEKKKWLGRRFLVLVEGDSLDRPEYLMGRSQYHGPEVDGLVLFRGDGCKPGDFVKVRITDAEIYDVIGEMDHDESGQ